jgi:hypothetical protein
VERKSSGLGVCYFKPALVESRLNWHQLEREGMDLSLPPLCNATLYKHCRRAGYQTYIWNIAPVTYRDLHPPTALGRRKVDNGVLEVGWLDSDIMPASMRYIIADNDRYQMGVDAG